MGQLVKKSNELIIRRKRKLAIRRSILFAVLLIGVLVTLCLKLPFFNIVTVSIENNKNVPAEIIEQLSGINKGNNIFYINNRNVKANITSNPYILDVKLTRKLPSTVVLDIKERDVTYYINDTDKYVILDSKGIILEIRATIENMDLVRLDGVAIASGEIGKPVNVDEARKMEVLSQYADIVKRNTSDVKLDSIDLTDLTNIRIYSSQLCFKIGDSYDIKEKLNKALNIAIQGEIKDKKGYIDVSYEGNPVLSVE